MSPYLLLQIALLVPGIIMGENLKLISAIRPSVIELLDVEIFGNHVFVPGGLGGLDIINVADPANPISLSRLTAEGCEYGRIYAWHASGDYAFGAGRACGIKVINISDLSSPTNEGLYQPDNGSYEHVAGFETLLFAAVHGLGVEIIDRSDPLDLKHIAWVQTTNAWALAVSENGGHLYVADGIGGLTIIDISDPHSASKLGTARSSGIAKDIAISGDYLFMAVGASGVDMYDISQPANPQLVSNYNTSGYASRISVSGNHLAVADWDDVEVLSWSAVSGLSLAGIKNTGGRVMAVAMKGDLVYSAEWILFRVFQFGSIETADIDLSTRKIDFPFLDPGQSLADTILITNSGAAILNINNAFADHIDFEVDLVNTTLEPGSSTEIRVLYTPTLKEGRAHLIIESDDPDEPTVTVTLRGNPRAGVDVGMTAANFTLPSVNGFPTTSLSDFRGQPVLLTLFASW